VTSFALYFSPSLTGQLDLRHNGITSIGAAELAKALSSFSRLTLVRGHQSLHAYTIFLPCLRAPLATFNPIKCDQSSSSPDLLTHSLRPSSSLV